MRRTYKRDDLMAGLWWNRYAKYIYLAEGGVWVFASSGRAVEPEDQLALWEARKNCDNEVTLYGDYSYKATK